MCSVCLILFWMQINYFRWDQKEESASDFFRFCRLMTKFRQWVDAFSKITKYYLLLLSSVLLMYLAVNANRLV